MSAREALIASIGRLLTCGPNIFARDDGAVNRSRMFAFGEGDEFIWSTLGGIDAGRAARTARVPSASEIAVNFRR